MVGEVVPADLLAVKLMDRDIRAVCWSLGSRPDVRVCGSARVSEDDAALNTSHQTDPDG